MVQPLRVVSCSSTERMMRQRIYYYTIETSKDNHDTEGDNDVLIMMFFPLDAIQYVDFMI